MKLQSIFSRVIILTFTLIITVSCQDDITVNPITIAGAESELKTIYLGQDIFQYEEYPDGTIIVEGDIIIPSNLILRLKEIAADPNGSIDD